METNLEPIQTQTRISFSQNNNEDEKRHKFSPTHTTTSTTYSSSGKCLTIVIKDEATVHFFRENTIDPEQFIKKSIIQYNNTQNKIDPHTLKGNYEEIKKVISQKKTILKLLSELQQAIYLIKFPESDKILLPFFGNSDETIMTCNICNTFRVYTKKGMISHQRKCIKNAGITPQITPPLENTITDVIF